jgi:hypothetical protein
MSAGVTYWVPEIHWKFDMVGRGGITASGLKSLSSDRGLYIVRISPQDEKKETTWIYQHTKEFPHPKR